MKCINNEKLKEQYMQLVKIDQWLPASLTDQIKLYRYKKGDFICHEGRKIEALYIQVQGKSKVTRLMSNGKETLTCFNEKTCMLGHLELFTHELAFNNVEVIEDTFCLVLPLSEPTRMLLFQDARFLCRMAKDLSQMLIKENQNSAINQVYPVRQRVASYILCTHQEGLFQDNYTHLAEYLGCSHRQLLRVFNDLVRENILVKEKENYRICQMHQLETIAAEVYSK